MKTKAIIFALGLFLLLDAAFILSKYEFVFSLIINASVVFPHPGGP
jgi:hypothetical protein